MDVGDEWAGVRMAGSGRMEERKGAEKGRDPLPRDHALSAAMPKAMAARPRPRAHARWGLKWLVGERGGVGAIAGGQQRTRPPRPSCPPTTASAPRPVP